MSSPSENKSQHHLYIVATPIGNPDDITLRAIHTLQSADAVICEEYRAGSTLLKKLDIQNKEIIELNEHNEQNEADSILQRILAGETLALISDCGTPVFADPGHNLIRLAAASGVRVIPVPGASSFMAALSILDFKLERFVFGGFLPREKDARSRELKKLQSMKMPVVLMDTPYRLVRLLDEVKEVFGGNRLITLASNLTQPDEKIYRGTIQNVKQMLQKNKSEFIMIIHDAPEGKNKHRNK